MAVERQDVAAAVAAVAGGGVDEAGVAAVASAVPVLSAWRRRERDRAAAAAWLYQVRWRPAQPPCWRGAAVLDLAGGNTAWTGGTATGAAVRAGAV